MNKRESATTLAHKSGIDGMCICVLSGNDFVLASDEWQALGGLVRASTPVVSVLGNCSQGVLRRGEKRREMTEVTEVETIRETKRNEEGKRRGRGGRFLFSLYCSV